MATYQPDSSTALFMDVISHREKCARRAEEMVAAERELVQTLHNQLIQLVVQKFNVDATKQRISIDYANKSINIEDLPSAPR